MVSWIFATTLLLGTTVPSITFSVDSIAANRRHRISPPALQSPFIHTAVYKNVPLNRRSSPLFGLDSVLSYNETATAPSTDFDQDFSRVTKNTVFPTPPPPPTDDELHANGLPILAQAAKHAEAGRTICYELPENGNVGVSYKTVMRDATRIADYIGKFTKNGEEKEGKPRTVAHLTEPGSEYLSSMWGVSYFSFTRKLSIIRSQ